MRHLISSEVSKSRTTKWFEQAVSLEEKSTWTERRQAISFGGHTYLIGKGQVYQCVHCGHFDPEWSATEVLSWFEETFGVKPFEIEITCSYSPVSEDGQT